LFSVVGDAGETVTLASEASVLNSVNNMDVSSVDAANLALATVDAALNTVSNQRAKFGAIQSRFGSTIANLSTNSENLSAARSRIRDTDFAKETAELTRNQILQQAGTAMLAQANVAPQNVLTLLQ
jgi:flagellin